MSEYELIRAEIRDAGNKVSQYNSVLYATTAALLAFAFDKDSFVFCLLPYVVILPLYILAEVTKRAECNKAAYLYVFCEGQDYRWEIRHHEYDKKDRIAISNNEQNVLKWTIEKMLSRFDYFSMNIICLIAALYKIVYSNSSYTTKWLQSIFVVTLTLVATIIMAIKAIDYVVERDKAIKQWRIIKAAEEAQKRNNNRNPQ